MTSAQQPATRSQQPATRNQLKIFQQYLYNLNACFAVSLIGLFLPTSIIVCMNVNRNTVFAVALLILVTAIFRMIPYELRAGWLGAPQFAMAIFAGSVVKQRRWAFALPVFSMLLSDIVMQVMYYYSPSLMPGFYSGQLANYLLIASLTVIGFFVSNRSISQVAAGAVAAPTVFFLLSNLMVWAGNGGWKHSKTFAGMIQTYADGLPFYKMDLLGTAVWSTVLFGSYLLITNSKKEMTTIKA